MDARVMGRAHLDRPRVRVRRVDVVVVDQPAARAGGTVKQEADNAVVARKSAPFGCLIHGSVHRQSLRKSVPIRPASMNVVVAVTAQPHQI